MIQALLAASGVGAKITKRLKGRAAKEREREANMDLVYNAGVQGFDVPANLGKPKDALDWLKYQASNSATDAGKAHAAQLYHQLAAQQHASHAKTAATKRAAAGGDESGISEAADTFGRIVATPGGARAVGTVVRELARSGMRRRTYYDAYGRRRTRYVREEGAPPDDETSGGGPSVGGAAAAAGGIGVVGGAAAAAAGVGAYLVTQRVLEHLGNEQLTREEAIVAADLALRDAFEDYKDEHGEYPAPSQRAAMKEAWARQIADLGYPVSWFGRAFQNFIRDYASQEE